MNPLNQSEKDVEKACVKYAKDLGWLYRKQQGQGNRGKTDRMFLLNGHTVFVEFKAPGKEPTVKQYRELQQLKDIGFACGWFDNIKDFKVWMNEVDKHLSNKVERQK